MISKRVAGANRLIRELNNNQWPEELANIAKAEAASIFTQARSGTIFNHKGVIIKSLLKGATQAILYGHGGMSPHQKRFQDKVVIPRGINWHYYSEHFGDTNSGIGYAIIKSSISNSSRPEPIETLHPGDSSHRYRLTNAIEGELILPSLTHDIIYIEPVSNTFFEDRSSTQFVDTVIEAIKTYRPEIRHVHAIHCRAVFERNRERIYEYADDVFN